MSNIKKINYRKISEYISVDIEKLRPSNSYKNLIDQRSHPIDILFKKYGEIPLDFLTFIKCPSCNSEEHSHELEKDHLKVVRCNLCDLVFTNPIFNEDHYDQIYKSEQYQNIVRGLGEESHEYRVARFGKERVDHLKNFFKKDQKISHLDVGCSTGFVVEAALNEGWDSSGIDLNPSAISFGKSRSLPIEEIDIYNIDVGKNYDVISMYDVLEHLYNPDKIIHKVKSLLKPNGLVHIYVPNYDSASRYLMGNEAHFIWPSHHLVYFTIDTINNFLTQRNFETLDVRTEGLDIFDYVWNKEQKKHESLNEIINISEKLQFFINAGGYGKNLRITSRLKK